MNGPVVTSENNLACCDATRHSNNIAELTAVIVNPQIPWKTGDTSLPRPTHAFILITNAQQESLLAPIQYIDQKDTAVLTTAATRSFSFRRRVVSQFEACCFPVCVHTHMDRVFIECELPYALLSSRAAV